MQRFISTTFMLSLATCSAADDPSIVTQRALKATADPAHADGESVAITMVAPNGVFTCEKPGGGAFTSDGANPVLQLRIDGQIVEEKFYNKNGDDPDEIIVFATAATSKILALNPGKHLAQCTALPDWPDLNPDTDPNDQWLACETATPAAPACTFSGVLEFLLQNVDVEPPAVVDLSQTLAGNCGNGQGGGGKKLCSGWIDIPPGEFGFKFPCLGGSTWNIQLLTLNSKSKKKNLDVLTKLSAFDPGHNPAPPSASKGKIDETTLDVEADGVCEARVTVYDGARIKLTLAPGGTELSSEECHELCTTEGTVFAGLHGCGCDAFCASTCDSVGVTCSGLPKCNIDFGRDSGEFGQYDCPFNEADAEAECLDWFSGEDFEHVGSCYRCNDGQQCCYSDGLDNGTGSFDLCPPFYFGPNGCGGLVHHCRCDVIPLCACLAVQGEIEACEACIGISDELDDGCNGEGVDAEFCANAVVSGEDGFDWCGILGNPNTCFDRP